MPLFRTILIIGVLFTLFACGESWPPWESEARAHFAENRESFERLADKIIDSDYRQAQFNPLSGEVTALLASNPNYHEPIVISDDPEWQDLFNNTRALAVTKNNGTVWTGSGGTWGVKENRSGDSGFTRDPNTILRSCEAEYEEIPCGLCEVQLENDWYIFYLWEPMYFSEAALQEMAEGKLTSDKYFESFYEEMKQCQIDGYTKMGYNADVVQRLVGR